MSKDKTEKKVIAESRLKAVGNDLLSLEWELEQATKMRLIGINLKFKGDEWLAVIKWKGKDGYYVTFWSHHNLFRLFESLLANARGGDLDYHWDKFSNKEVDD